MKVRNRHLVRLAGGLGSAAVRGLVRTLRVETLALGDIAPPAGRVPAGRRMAIALWHEHLILPAVGMGHPEVSVLISKHADGQILASLIRSLGMGLVLGSTNRGGVEAVRQILDGNAGCRHLAVTVDGPRGPRRVVQPGIVYAASRCGMELLPVGVGYQQAWRARSWDRFAVPKPGSRAKLLLGAPLAVPAGLGAAGLERYRLWLQAELDRLDAAAGRWAETGRLTVPPATPVPVAATRRRAA
jgi:lysophospholipid acyltransferase (LPLAT)-like uncharacterized protein